MASNLKNLSVYNKDKMPEVKDMAFGIVVSEWHESICEAMKDACIKTFIDNGVSEENIHIAYVPGSFELPSGARMMLNSQKLDAIVCIGCVIKGETKHDEYINSAVANGLMQLSLMSGKSCVFCVLTTNTEDEARDRSGGQYGNKGTEAAITALRMAGLKSILGKPEKKIGF